MSIAIPSRTLKHAWKLHDAETDTRAPPTQNVYHEIFDLAGGQKFHYITIKQTNDEVAAKNVDVKLTIDGETYEKTGLSFGNGEIYYLYWTDIGLDPPAATLGASNSGILPAFGFSMDDSAGAKFIPDVEEMTAAKLEVKMTSAPGTNQVLATVFRRSSKEVV